MDYFLSHHPDFGLVNALTLDGEGQMHIRQELELVFHKPGMFKLMFPTSKAATAKSCRRQYPQLR